MKGGSPGFYVCVCEMVWGGDGKPERSSTGKFVMNLTFNNRHLSWFEDIL